MAPSTPSSYIRAWLPFSNRRRTSPVGVSDVRVDRTVYRQNAIQVAQVVVVNCEVELAVVGEVPVLDDDRNIVYTVSGR